MAGAIIFLLPPPGASGADTHWWLVGDNGIAERGVGGEWVGFAVPESGLPMRAIALAPTGAVRVEQRPVAEGMTPRQAAAVARVEAIDSSLGDRETLHAVAAALGDRAVITAVVANATMLEWLDWCVAAGVDPDAIVPTAALVPADDGWQSARIGNDAFLLGDGRSLPNEPGLAEMLVGPAEVLDVPADAIDAAIAALANGVPIDLRSGRFARRKRLFVDRGRIRELLILAAIIPLLTLLWALVSIAKLNASASRLDAETAAIASQAVGRPVAAADAEAELTERFGGLGPGFAAPLAALFQGLQAESTVSSTQIGYGSGGTLSVTLAAPAVTDINRLLLALQRDGYRVTAVPRQAPDGRAMVDITLRTGP